jgi:predicted XRE-type DNA-binding protein
LCHNCHITKSKECKDISVKIDKDITIAICNDYFSTNMTQAEIGQKYGITQRTVSSIVRGERWIKETLLVDRSFLD